MMRSTLEPPAPAVEPTPLTPEQKEWLALVKRIAASEVLARASQLREILLYVVHRYLHDTYPIKERDIACEVLKRPPNFDGTLDNIVRVQVGHLRRKLDQYFATEGKDEPLLIVIPRGSYIPRFEPRDRPLDKPRDAADLETLPPAHEETVHIVEPPRTWIAVAAILAVVISAIGLFIILSHSAPAATALLTPAPRASNPITQRIFGSTNAVSVVAADTNLLLIEAMLNRNVSITEYSAPNYPFNLETPQTPQATRDMLRMIAVRRYTSFGDAAVTVLASKVAAQFGKDILPRYSRFINTRDLQQGNTILIGKSPWLELFTPKLNFVQADNPATPTHAIENRNPLPGEQKTYPVIGNWSNESTSYACIAMLPNPTQTGYILILDGTGMEATEAAMDFLSNPDTAEKMRQILKGRDLDEREPLEMLMRVHSVLGTAHDFEIVAVRSKTK